MGFEPRLAEFGWDAAWQRLAEEHGRAGTEPGRVVLQGRDAWHVRLAGRTVVAQAGSRRQRASRAGDAPVTGDWVLVRSGAAAHDSTEPASDGVVLIEGILPRRTTVVRASADGRSREHVLAANADIVAVCAAADRLNERRLERELVAAWQSGATPLVIVTKADLVDDIDTVLAAASAAAPGVDVVAATMRDPESVQPIRAVVTSGRTMALLGASGIGKSTLVNSLVGAPVQLTRDVRSDGKGRHTTTSRQLLSLPGGGMVLDTPGLRSFGVWTGAEGLAEAFPELDELAGQCRFRDCAHDGEPGCAVQGAIADGSLPIERWQAWQALQREQAWLARRADARLMAEERRRWVTLTREARARIRP